MVDWANLIGSSLGLGLVVSSIRLVLSSDPELPSLLTTPETAVYFSSLGQI